MRRRSSIVLAVFLVLALPILMGPASNRSYVSGSYMLELDGVQTGHIKSVQGGNVYAEVINEASGPDYFVRKHVGQPKYEDFEIKVGLTMAKPVYEWIAESWRMDYQRKNGAVVAEDYNGVAQSRREFYNALITETTIPAMDGSSKEPGYLTVKFAPEYVRSAKAAGGKGAATAANLDPQKQWLPSNFRLEIAGLDASKVSKIDAFTVKQSTVQDALGSARDYQLEPGKLEFPNLKITLSAASADDWLAWHEDFVIKGNNDQTKEKNGTLSLLSTNRKEVLATVRFYNMGILSICEAAPGSEGLQSYQAELYVERMEFEGPGASGKGLN